MAYALMGFVSFESSDAHWFIYPHDLVAFVDQESVTGGDDNDDNDGKQLDLENMLNEMLAEVDRDEEVSRGSRGKRSRKCGETRSYTVDGKLVFVTQAESFKYRGQHFEAFNPLEFECIVDILPPKKDQAAPSSTTAGRLVDLRSHWHPCIPCLRTASARTSVRSS